MIQIEVDKGYPDYAFAIFMGAGRYDRMYEFIATSISEGHSNISITLDDEDNRP